MAIPHWEATPFCVTLVVILRDPSELLVEESVIHKELDEQISKISLPSGIPWSDSRFFIGSLDSLPARAIYDSQLLDFSYLSAI